MSDPLTPEERASIAEAFASDPDVVPRRNAVLGSDPLTEVRQLLEAAPTATLADVVREFLQAVDCSMDSDDVSRAVVDFLPAAQVHVSAYGTTDDDMVVVDRRLLAVLADQLDRVNPFLQQASDANAALAVERNALADQLEATQAEVADLAALLAVAGQ